MTPNHPIPPERIRAEAERVAPFTLEQAERYTNRASRSYEQDVVDAVNDDRERRVPLVDVSAVQREAEDRVTKHYDGVVLEREREAARKAWDAAMELARNSDRVLNGFRVVEVGDLWVERDRYLAREYPAPAPRECVLSWGVMAQDKQGQWCVWSGWPVDRGTSLLAVTDSPWHHVRCFADAEAIKSFAERAK